MGKRSSLQRLIAKMERDGSSASEEAALILARADAGIDALVAATRHPEDYVRSTAAFALRGRNRPDVVAALRDLLLTDNDPFILETACNSLGAIGAPAAAAIDALESLLAKGPNRPSAAASLALGNIGPAAAVAIPALVEVLRRSEHKPKRPLDVTYAVDALWKLRARVPDLPSILVNLLTTGENALTFKYSAIELLGLHGASAEVAEPLLRGCLKYGSVSMRSAAAAALARISRPEEMVGYLITQLEHGGDADPRLYVAEQLASLGTIAAPAIPYLRGLRGSKDEEDAAAAAVKAIEAALAEQLGKG